MVNKSGTLRLLVSFVFLLGALFSYRLIHAEAYSDVSNMSDVLRGLERFGLDHQR